MHETSDDLTNSIDIEKPILKENEILCSGCWKVIDSKKATGKWKIFLFEHLDPLVLCQECQLKEQRDIKVKQEYGL